MSDEKVIATAALRCFLEPGAEAVAHLEALLPDGAAGPKAAERLMHQCVLILQTANAVLAEEGRQLADILAGQGKALVCAPGCAGCCHQLVLCQPFEAHSIHAYLVSHPESLHSFQAACPLWQKSTAPMLASYLAWAEASYGQGEDDGSHVFDDYQSPCPFLDGQNCCVIYPVRPYGCRTCIAVDPACVTPAFTGKGQSGTLQMQYSLYTTHHAARMALSKMLVRRLGADPTPVPMPQVLAALCGL